LLRPEEFSSLVARIRPSDRRRATAVRLKFCWQTQVFVSAANQQVSREVGLVQTLLDDDLMSLRWIIVASAHGTVPKFHSCSPLRIRSGLIDAVGIVYHDVVASFAGPSRHRNNHPIASTVIFETLLLVLIAAQLVARAPSLLVPIRFNQTSSLQTVADGQRFAVTGEQPPGFRMVDPNPCWPKDAYDQRLGMAGRNIDDQVPNPAFRDGL